VLLADDLVDESVGDLDLGGAVDLESAEEVVRVRVVVDFRSLDLDGAAEIVDVPGFVFLFGRFLELLPVVAGIGRLLGRDADRSVGVVADPIRPRRLRAL